MPRNGQNIYSKPAGTTAVSGTPIDSTDYNDTIDDLVADANAARPITAGGTGGVTPAAARTGLELDKKVVYAAKSANYTAVADDNNAVLRFTAAATLSLTAAATLAANWHITVVADGGAVTIDPNGSETINGLATIGIPNGSSASIICDGSNFFTVINSDAWVTIGAPVVFSGQSNVDWLNLGNYRRLRLVIDCAISSAGGLRLQVSTNNGSSFIAGASDYAFSFLSQAGTGVGGGEPATASGLLLSNQNADSGTYMNATVDVGNFNQNLPCTHKADNIYTASGGIRRDLVYGYTAASAARNALRLAPSAGVLSGGQVLLQGLRG